MYQIVKSIAVTLICLAAVNANAQWQPGKSSSKGTTEVQKTIERFVAKDEGLKAFFDEAYGYAIFPGVGKGGIGIGGAFWRGEVYEQNQFVGTARLTQISIGFQFVGQKYSEVVFFGSKEALDDFKRGNFEFSAQASAVAVTAGASADAAYSNDVAVFTMAIGGLMYEATIGGQKFSYTPK